MLGSEVFCGGGSLQTSLIAGLWPSCQILMDRILDVSA